MQGQKVLITGAAGQIAFPICEYLASDNEVFGLDLYGRPGSEERVREAGATPIRVDLGSGDFGDLPDDFDYVLHLAAYLGTDSDYDAALRVNAEGTGLLLAHCRKARAALVMSTGGVYDANPDPWHKFKETDPLGDSKSPYVPTYSVTKIAEEAVARTSCRVLDLPVVITRMNTSYGPNGGVPASQLDSIIAGTDVILRGDPIPASPIYQGDINAQAEALLGAASVPATVVNWGGDDGVTQQEWCGYLSELVGRPAKISVREGVRKGAVVDVSKRLSITGPCKTAWRDGMRLMFEQRYPDGPDGPRKPGVSAAHALEAYTQRQAGTAN